VELKTAAWALFAVSLIGCRQAPKEPVTLNFLRLGWSQPDELPTADPLSQRFTVETGIHIRHLPVPENTLDQLELSRKLLQAGVSAPDVLGVDVIWTGALADDLSDLGPDLAPEIATLEPALVPSYTVNGKLVAIPYQIQVAVLEYRTDLLRKYGYDHPPKTWDELETMAALIQEGERAAGKKDFWGYVWQGAANEALTCNAIEWQAAEGGGRIIEDNKKVSVNNPAAIRAWQRAKRWIGRISPPSVLAYRELDSMNVFDSEKAAFNRVWGGATISRSRQSSELHWRSSLAIGKTGYSSIPGGPGGWAGTLGGSGLAVSARSTHRKEAVELVRFLIREQVHSEEVAAPNPPLRPEVYDRPSLADSPNSSGIVSRPSSVTGYKYEQVAKAYIGAVHAVLAGEQGAPEAAAELEKQLIDITGFTPGPPLKPIRNVLGESHE
jgi:trehalose/maltose transport system substrate-binding protein